MLNPFRKPAGSTSEADRLSREKFKVGFLSALVTTALFLVGTLIEGCHAQNGDNEALSKSSNIPVTSPTNGSATATNSTGVAASPVEPTNAITLPGLVLVPAGLARLPASLAANGPERMYLVQPGDTLYRIARSKSTTVQALKTLNGLEGDRIDAGEKLKIPVDSVSGGPAAQ